MTAATTLASLLAVRPLRAEPPSPRSELASHWVAHQASGPLGSLTTVRYGTASRPRLLLVGGRLGDAYLGRNAIGGALRGEGYLLPLPNRLLVAGHEDWSPVTAAFLGMTARPLVGIGFSALADGAGLRENAWIPRLGLGLESVRGAGGVSIEMFAGPEIGATRTRAAAAGLQLDIHL